MRNRTLAAAAVVLGALVLLVVPALAHVSVNPDTAAPGSFTKLAFRVPTERDDASTVKLDVKLPTDHPIANVSVKPKPGWTADVKKETLATPITSDEGQSVTEVVSEITWSGGQIKPGEFDEFEISVGPLPDDVDQLTFPAIQTYSDGQEVAWIEDTPAGGPEPEHPAPVLKLVADASSDEHSHASESSSSSSGTTVSSSSEAAASDSHGTSSDSDSNGLAVAALIVGGLGLLTGIAALVRGRSGSTPA